MVSGTGISTSLCLLLYWGLSLELVLCLSVLSQLFCRFLWVAHSIFSPGVCSEAVLGSELEKHKTCPNHLHRCIWMVSCIVTGSALLPRSPFEMVFGLKILRKRLRHLFWNTSSFLSMATVVFQQSEPYRSTPKRYCF